MRKEKIFEPLKNNDERETFINNFSKNNEERNFILKHYLYYDIYKNNKKKLDFLCILHNVL